MDKSSLTVKNSIGRIQCQEEQDRLHMILTMYTKPANMLYDLLPAGVDTGKRVVQRSQHMILERIRKAYPHLTKSQKALADFIASSYRDVAFMTASRLADTVELDEATVIRFAQRLGYPGYPELVEEIQELVRHELSEAKVTSREPLLTELYSEIEELRRVAEHIPPQAAQEAVEVLQEAESIYVVGQGTGAALSKLFVLALRSIGLSALYVAGDLSELFLALDDLADADLLVAFSTQNDPLTARAVEYANRKGAATLALAWSPTAPCARSADVSLSYALSDTLRIRPIALTAALIDALTGRLKTLNREQAETRRRRQAEIRAFFDDV
jgi:DNA-binding MurR/RpiR family transcriptional regulator